MAIFDGVDDSVEATKAMDQIGNLLEKYENRVLVERRFWWRNEGRIYLGATNITNLLTGPHPQFVISEEE